MSTDGKKPWKHRAQCDYCKSQSFPPEKFPQGNKPALMGCKHFRGGKTRAKKGLAW